MTQATISSGVEGDLDRALRWEAAAVLPAVPVASSVDAVCERQQTGVVRKLRRHFRVRKQPLPTLANFAIKRVGGFSRTDDRRVLLNRFLLRRLLARMTPATAGRASERSIGTLTTSPVGA